MTAPDRSPKTVFNLVQASTVKSKRTKWLVENMIPWNGLTLLGGREGVGKSTIACAWVAAATLGNLDNKEPLNVIYLHTEDSREATIVPRLRAADADLERIYFLDIELQYDGEDPIESGLVLPAHFPPPSPSNRRQQHRHDCPRRREVGNGLQHRRQPR